MPTLSDDPLSINRLRQIRDAALASTAAGVEGRGGPPDTVTVEAEDRNIETVNEKTDDVAAGEGDGSAANQPANGDASEGRDDLNEGEAKRTAAAFAAMIDEIIENASNQIGVKLSKLDGVPVDVSLSTARDRIQPDPAEVDSALRTLVVEARVRRRTIEGASRSGREPERFREWLTTVPTSEAAVTTTSQAGRMGARTALVTMFVGLVNIGAAAMTPSLLAQSLALELSLTRAQVQRDLANAVAEKKPETEKPSDMADDGTTAQVLRRAFVQAAARGLRADLDFDVPENVAQRRAVRDIAAVEARHSILDASARSAASSADPGRARQVFQAVSPTEVSNEAQHAVAMLDETLDHRIAQLRQNDTLWRQLRASAATPARPDYTAGALLRTVIGSNPIARSPLYGMWVEQATG